MAIKKISANLLGNNAVTAASIAGGAISAADIADNSITAAKISTSTFAIDSLTVNTSDLVVDTANNRVGIGTSGPLFVLDVTGATADVAKFKRSSIGTTEVLIDTAGSGDAQLVFADNGTDSYAIGRDNTNGDFVIAASGAVGTSNLINIESGGNVGIGTDSPSSELHIDSNNTDTTITIESDLDGSSLFTSGIDLKREGVSKGARIESLRDPSVGGVGLKFLTTADNSAEVSGTLTSRMVILETGEVGIGMDNPSVPLHVKSTGSLPARFEGVNHSYTAWLNSSGTAGYVGSSGGLGSGGATDLGVRSENNLIFLTNAGSERMRITSDGKIGINEGTPTGKLHVYDPNFSGYMLNLTNGGTGGGNHGFLMECASTSAYLGIWKTQGTTRFYVDGSGTMYNDAKQGLMGATASADIACQSGTNTPSTKTWRWGGHSGNDTGYFINSNNNGVYLAWGSGSWTTHSDERLKENIEDIGSVLNLIQNYRCVKFNLKSTPEREVIGFIAQDWETDFPQVVDEDIGFTLQEDGTLLGINEEGNVSTKHPKSISYTETIPVLLKAIQELKTELDAAKARITELENA